MTNISETPTARALRYLDEVTHAKTLPPSEQVAWAIGHQREAASIIRALLIEQEGYRDATKARTLLELQLLDAIRPLYSRDTAQRFEGTVAEARRIARYTWLEGVAPDLREAFEALEKSIVR